MGRKRFRDMNCGIAQALEALGDWWTLLIVRDAFFGARRFGDFEKSLGIAKNILSDRLQRLVEHEIFRQVDVGESRPALRVPAHREGRGPAAAAHGAARLVRRVGLRARARAGDREGPAHEPAHAQAARHRRRGPPAHAPRSAQRAGPGGIARDRAPPEATPARCGRNRKPSSRSAPRRRPAAGLP